MLVIKRKASLILTISGKNILIVLFIFIKKSIPRHESWIRVNE